MKSKKNDKKLIKNVNCKNKSKRKQQIGMGLTMSKLTKRLQKPSQSYYYQTSPYSVLRADPRTTTTQQRKQARKDIQKIRFESYNKERATRALDPITFDEFKNNEEEKNKAEESFIIQYNARQMNLEDKQLEQENFKKQKLLESLPSRMSRKERMALEAQNNYQVNMRNFQTHLDSEQGQRDLERLTIVKKRREEDKIKRELEGRAPGWTPNGIEISSDEDDDYNIEDTNNSIIDVASENLELPSQTQIINNDLIDNRLKLIYSSDNYFIAYIFQMI